MADKKAKAKITFIKPQPKPNKMVIEVQEVKEEEKKSVADETSYKIKIKPKSRAKAYGLKSTLITKDLLILTSFGKGNAGLIAKRIDTVPKIVACDEEPIFEKPIFEIRDDELLSEKELKLHIHSSDIAASSYKPLFDLKEDNHYIAPQDRIRAKKQLEMEYFGETYDDNIHIQLIYNIMDVKKLLGLYISDAIFAVNNLARDYSSNDRDSVGMTLHYNSYDKMSKAKRDAFELFYSNSLNNLSYYQKPFKVKEEKEIVRGKEKNKIVVEKENVYKALRCLSLIRNFVLHDNIESKENQAVIYNIFSKEFKNNDLSNYIDDVFSEQINDFNVNFSKLNIKNFKMLYDTRSNQNLSELMTAYYEFIVFKSFKNLGFSLVKLREEMLLNSLELNQLTSDDHDAYRSKLYQAMDYVIYRYVISEEELISSLVEDLRSIVDDFDNHTIKISSDEKKNNIYRLYANKIIKNSVLVNEILKLLESLKKTIKVSADVEEFLKHKPQHVVGDSSVLEFHVLNYIVNDINIYNTLIKLHESMNRADTTKDKAQLKIKAKEIYQENATKIFGDNSLVESIIKDTIGLEGYLSKYISSENFQNFSKLIYFLCLFLDGKEINELISKLINKFENIAFFGQHIMSINLEFVSTIFEINTATAISENLRVMQTFTRMSKTNLVKESQLKDAAKLLKVSIESGITELYGEVKKGENGFRNFIINNVIKSKRFNYIVRYSDVGKVGFIMNNRSLLKFVLKRIPENQLLKNAERIGLGSCDQEVILDELSRKLKNLQFSDFKYIDTQAETNTKASEDKKHAENLLGLYMTVMYIIVKNLVRVNSIYVLAFMAFDRDYFLHIRDSAEEMKIAKDMRHDYYYNKLTKHFVSNNWLKPQNLSYIEDNGLSCRSEIEVDQNEIYQLYRNLIVHYNPLMEFHKYVNELNDFESYFQMFNFTVQKILEGKLKLKLTQFKQNTAEVGENEKDFRERCKKHYPTRVVQYFELLDTHHNYVKDFVKFLNLPFAYQYGRYKNLTIYECFNRMDILSQQEKDQ